VPQIKRDQPAYLQIVEHYQEEIASGQLRPGDKLPSVRAIAEEWHCSPGVAAKAFDTLKANRLLVTSNQGTFVAAARLMPGPQQRLRAQRFPEAARIDVLVAEMIPAPEYVRQILGLDEAGPGQEPTAVIHREQVSYEITGEPVMLASAWFRGELAGPVPELLYKRPIEYPGGAARLIESRAGQRITRGRQAREARVIKDDGREGPLLRLQSGSFVLAEVYLWLTAEDVTEYGEYILIADRITENEFEVAAEPEQPDE